MISSHSFKLLLALASVAGVSVAGAADPWADDVVDYDPGSNPDQDAFTMAPFTDPLTALGEPTRFTSDAQNFGGPTTPFQSSYRSYESVSLGNGGRLIVSFDEPVVDDPLNPFGIDLLIFGNAFYELDFGTNLATGTVGSEGGVIEVSADGVEFETIVGVAADGKFPTVGYLDVIENFPSTPGSVLSDFTKPVNPTFDATGLNVTQIIAGYNGSGGGAGIDLAGTGLAQIRFVRITNPNASGRMTPEIDGFADVTPVPEPAAWQVLALGALIFLGKSAQRVTVNKA